jgi:hypothetical protein
VELVVFHPSDEDAATVWIKTEVCRASNGCISVSRHRFVRPPILFHSSRD